MKSSLRQLYAHIVRFLVRAYDWYKEGTLKHIVHSITRPVELRYDDLLQNIAQSSRVIEQLASSGHQAEFRDMHNEIDISLKHSTRQLTEIRSAVSSHSAELSMTTERLSDLQIFQDKRLKGISTTLDAISLKVEELSTAVSLHSTAMVDTNQRVTDQQFTQMMTLLLQPSNYDPIKTFRYHQLVRHRPSHTPLQPLSDRFWLSPILRRWSGSQKSDIALVLGNYQSRFALRNLVVDVIEQLQTARVPVLMAPKPVAQVEATSSESCTDNALSVSGLIKNLVRQGLQVAQQQQLGGGGNVHTERSMARSCAQFFGTDSPKDLFQLLEAVLCEIRGQVYLVVDLGVLLSEQQQRQATRLAASNDREGGFMWLDSFLKFFAELSERSNNANRLLKPTVKVLLVSYDAASSFCLSATSQSGYVVQARTEVATARSRKSRRHVMAKQTQLRLNLPNIQKGRKPI
ncbi:hypothetical protein LA080_002964 [Diaporthe eres]|nr:hypothetical protein LA080_002964 [Diaporthe eres]